MSNTKKEADSDNREQPGGYQWGEGSKEGQDKDEGKGTVIVRLYEIMCVNSLKIVKHYRI